MPLETEKDSPPYRSCQPMHVLSFVGGRKFCFVVCCWCGVLVILSRTWRQLGRHSPQLLDRRFDCEFDSVVCKFFGSWSWEWFLA